MDEYELNRQLDKLKIRLFDNDNAAFLGSLMGSLKFIWDRTRPTASTNGTDFRWNPDWFLSLEPETRSTILLHELWHVARLHMVRAEKRDFKIWNYACDIRINNDLEREGRSFKGVENCWKDPEYDQNGIAAEEDIYEQLIKNAVPVPQLGTWGQPDEGGDIEENPADHAEVVAAVVRATQAAQMAGQAENLPRDIHKTLESFLDPVIPWRTVLMQWSTDLLEEDYTWSRPNRRYQDEYLPSRFLDEGRLDHLAFIEDVSGSIQDKDSLRFNSEVKYVQEVLRPRKLTLVQFDTKITNVRVFTEDEPFEKVELIGGGGTSLRPVRKWIEKNKPTAAIIFSDLECDPMKPLSKPIPVIWAAIRNKHAQVPFGKLIHIKD